ncbi:MAG: hypothetical protein IRY99_16400, partial [Isosphaeraceae bacterium]|nr:hypothetical protein [Isosphaeraceae bacterium]
AQWPAQFAARYKGRSVIIEAHLIVEKESKRLELDYSILVGRGPKPARTGKIDLTGFRLFEGVGKKEGDVVLFGARLAEVRLDADGRTWRVALQPDSGVFLRHFKALHALGWPGPEPLAEARP